VRNRFSFFSLCWQPGAGRRLPHSPSSVDKTTFLLETATLLSIGKDFGRLFRCFYWSWLAKCTRNPSFSPKSATYYPAALLLYLFLLRCVKKVLPPPDLRNGQPLSPFSRLFFFITVLAVLSSTLRNVLPPSPSKFFHRPSSRPLRSCCPYFLLSSFFTFFDQGRQDVFPLLLVTSAFRIFQR